MNPEPTLLDQFAIAALPAVAETNTALAIEAAIGGDRAAEPLLNKDKWACEAFMIAEAMMIESNKRRRSI